MQKEKIALVTGGGRGIGRETALELARKGCSVAVNYSRSEKAARETVAEIEAIGRRAFAFKADVSSAAEVKEMFTAVASKLGPVEILVCNAGITRDNLLMRMKDEDWNDVITADLSSLFYCAREALRPMLKARWGRIIAISSVTGLVGNPGQCNYAAAKAGMTGFIKSLAREVGSRGITANAVAPGYIDTDMTSVLPPEIRETMLKNIPSGRTGTPSDIAKAVAFLASDDSEYIQGQVIAVDGGMTM
ncbi:MULTISPECIES: 3-oxoacyl-[acyl-carrier-protein] reductase [Synergistaceae]|jgi:3-oxoacyl-[acyl-carrier protein] reductase|uniref:3-oxoacyl-[acyl-carrier-protein] reductase n=1 Tax=Synergistaceae TaxID=649777 RepID=UPI0026B99592|nr:3-oxoacyl-[acyl-carrier-protein] reductase [Synergistaceae bacterium DZ-S4]